LSREPKAGTLTGFKEHHLRKYHSKHLAGWAAEPVLLLKNSLQTVSLIAGAERQVQNLILPTDQVAELLVMVRCQVNLLCPAIAAKKALLNCLSHSIEPKIEVKQSGR